MTFGDLKKRVGKNIKYYTDTDGFLSDRDISEADIGEYVNEVYKEELFPLFASKFPHRFRHTGLLNSWIMSATVNASSTGTTLVIDTSSSSEFTNSMVGLKVYNETDDETVEITAYSSASTVTVDTTIGDTWDGDTIYVLGQEFALGGDATDLFIVERVKVDYAGTANSSRLVGEVRNKQDFIDTGSEVYDRTFPYVYLTSVQDGAGTMVNAIGILPKFDKKISNAIEIDYLAEPTELSSDTDIPTIPADASIIAGATMKLYEKRQNVEMVEMWMMKYERAMLRDVSRYRTYSNSQARRIYPKKNTYYTHRRLI